MSRTSIARYAGPPRAAVDAFFSEVPGERDSGREPVSIAVVGDELVVVYAGASTMYDYVRLVFGSSAAAAFAYVAYDTWQQTSALSLQGLSPSVLLYVGLALLSIAIGLSRMERT